MTHEDGGQEIHLPEYLLPLDGSTFLHSEQTQEEIELLPWFTRAYELAENKTLVSRALHAHHHALLLEQKSPSFALVCYVAAIEGLGEYLSDETEPGARFRAALATVYTSEEVVELDDLYRPRSATAHSGKLYGGEPFVGGSRLGLFDLFAPPLQYSDFRHNELIKIRQASKRVLTNLFET